MLPVRQDGDGGRRCGGYRHSCNGCAGRQRSSGDKHESDEDELDAGRDKVRGLAGHHHHQTGSIL